MRVRYLLVAAASLLAIPSASRAAHPDCPIGTLSWYINVLGNKTCMLGSVPVSNFSYSLTTVGEVVPYSLDDILVTPYSSFSGALGTIGFNLTGVGFSSHHLSDGETFDLAQGVESNFEYDVRAQFLLGGSITSEFKYFGTGSHDPTGGISLDHLVIWEGSAGCYTSTSQGELSTLYGDGAELGFSTALPGLYPGPCLGWTHVTHQAGSYFRNTEPMDLDATIETGTWFDVLVTPEPSTWALVAIGLTLVLLGAWRRRAKSSRHGGR